MSGSIDIPNNDVTHIIRQSSTRFSLQDSHISSSRPHRVRNDVWQTAVSFIDNLDAASLSMDPDDFAAELKRREAVLPGTPFPFSRF